MGCCCARKGFDARVWAKDSDKDIEKMHENDAKYEKLKKIEIAVFGVINVRESESYFGAVSGVVRTKAGYRIAQGKVQAAFIVEVQFNPKKANYGEILRAFWRIKSSRKKSACILYKSDKQKKIAQASIVEHFLGKNHEKTWTQATKDKRVKNFHLINYEKYNDMERKDQKYGLQKHKNIFNILGLEKTKTLIHSHFAARLNGYLNGYGTVDQLNTELLKGKLKLSKSVEQAVRMKMARPVINKEVEHVKKAMAEERGVKYQKHKKEEKERETNVEAMDKFTKRRKSFMKDKEEKLKERKL